MGRAREKLFKRKPTRWPTLEKLVEEGILLEVDLAYAALHASEEKEAAHHAALIAMARRGHLAYTKEALESLSPILAALARDFGQLPKFAHLEKELLAHIKRLLSYKEKAPPTIDSPWLTAEQKKAVENGLAKPLSLITGGPGTGKTFTAAEIAKAHEGKVLLAAPTGKAARHLKSKIDAPATTLHSLLREKTLDADLVIVDESSMIPPNLFLRLFEAIQEGTTLILMGDVHQLPAVEGGSLFADLIDLSLIPTTRLTYCMRSDLKEILETASQILEGKPPSIPLLKLGFEDNNLDALYENLWSHTKDLFPKSWCEEINSFRILSTLRRGPLGVDALNQFFYEKFAPSATEVPILILQNDPKTGLCNGDVGVLLNEKEAFFPENGARFPASELPPYEYAYCLSVHKAQGSEYDHVLVLVPEGSEVFGREVLYTAVTRAKHKLEIDGAPTQIERALAQSSRKLSHFSKH